MVVENSVTGVGSAQPLGQTKRLQDFDRPLVKHDDAHDAQDLEDTQAMGQQASELMVPARHTTPWEPAGLPP